MRNKENDEIVTLIDPCLECSEFAHSLLRDITEGTESVYNDFRFPGDGHINGFPSKIRIAPVRRSPRDGILGWPARDPNQEPRFRLHATAAASSG